MKKTKVAILLDMLSLGGTERSAIIFAKNIDLKKFEVSLVFFSQPDRKFLSRIDDVRHYFIQKDDLKKWVSDNKIDIIYSFSNFDEGMISAIKKEGKLVQGVIFTRQYNKLNDANLMISKTEWLKVKLCNGGKIINDYVIYNPIDVKTWEKLAKTAMPYCHDKNRIILGRIGRAEPSKWHYSILALLSECKKKNEFKRYRFIFVGMPKLYVWYINLFLSKELKDGSIMLLSELVNDFDLARFYKSLDVFLQSAWIGESFGCVIAEAFCFDVPVITDWKHFARPDGSVNENLYDSQIELVDHGKNGFYGYYPSMILDQLRNQTKESLRNLGKNGHKKVNDTYAAQKVVKSLENLFLGEILKKDKKLASKINPSREEIDESYKHYVENFKLIDTVCSTVSNKERKSFFIRERAWRFIEYVYLAVRKIALKLGYNIEQHN